MFLSVSLPASVFPALPLRLCFYFTSLAMRPSLSMYSFVLLGLSLAIATYRLQRNQYLRGQYLCVYPCICLSSHRSICDMCAHHIRLSRARTLSPSLKIRNPLSTLTLPTNRFMSAPPGCAFMVFWAYLMYSRWTPTPPASMPSASARSPAGAWRLKRAMRPRWVSFQPRFSTANGL